MGSKKVLIISYLFPPIAGGGVPRALKFSKYLPQNEWHPVILTVDPKYHVSLDESLLNQVHKDTPIYRAWEFNPYEKLNKLRTASSSSGSKEENSAQADSGNTGAVQQIKQTVFQGIKAAKSYIAVPDDHIFWVPFAIKEGLKAIKEQKIDVIYSTSGPYSSHLVGRALAKKTGLPWIADFRDPWTQNMHRSGIPWREKREEKMESQVMHEADIVLTVTHTFAKNFKSKYPSIKQLEVIHNGYDPEDYEGIQENKQEDKLTLAYTGIFYQKRNPRLLLEAISELINENKIVKEDLRLKFAGVFDYPGQSENQDAVNRFNLNDIVEVLGYLPHHESLSLLKNSDVQLLVGDTAPGSEAYIPGKLYEYIAVQRPILALSLPGESEAIINKFKVGEVVPPTNKEAIKEAIYRLYHAWKNGSLEQSYSFEMEKEELATYRRDIQAKELSELCNQLIEKRPV